jgi:hypothetical protein
VPEGIEEPPMKLVAELKSLMPKRQSILNMPANELVDVAPPVSKENREKISWGSDEAKAAYFEFSREIDQWEDKNRRKFELGMRAAENAVRCATIVAAGCFSPTVDVGDIEWALKWSRVSFEAAEGGVKRYMHNYFEFPKFCEQVVERIDQEQDDFMSNRDLSRAFRRNMKYGHELDKVLAHLVKEGRIREGSRKKAILALPHRVTGLSGMRIRGLVQLGAWFCLGGGGDTIFLPSFPPPPPSKIGNPGQVHIEFVSVDEDKGQKTDDQIQQRSESHMMK